MGSTIYPTALFPAPLGAWALGLGFRIEATWRGRGLSK